MVGISLVYLWYIWLQKEAQRVKEIRGYLWVFLLYLGIVLRYVGVI